MTAKELRANAQGEHIAGSVLGSDGEKPPMLSLEIDRLTISDLTSNGVVELYDDEFCALLRIGVQWFPEALSEKPKPKESDES